MNKYIIYCINLMGMEYNSNSERLIYLFFKDRD